MLNGHLLKNSHVIRIYRDQWLGDDDGEWNGIEETVVDSEGGMLESITPQRHLS